MTARGKHAGAVKRKRQEEALAEISDWKGHVLAYATFKLNPAKDRCGQDSCLLLTCSKCRGLGGPADFREPCCGRDKWKRWHSVLAKLVAAGKGNLEQAISLFGLSEEEVAVLLPKAPVLRRF